MKIYNPSLEERAFLYQEAQDLAPLVKNLGTLSVLVEEMGEVSAISTENRYRVTFLVAPESMALQIQAESPNLFAATIKARQETQRQLNALVNALNPQEGPLVPLH